MKSFGLNKKTKNKLAVSSFAAFNKTSKNKKNKKNSMLKSF